MTEKKFPRGSEWRIWDLHIHTPASFHWNGQRFGNDDHKNDALVDQTIKALNAAEADAFAIMDYWTFDGWFLLQKRLKDVDAPELKKTVFPGIELRICTPTDVRLNAHVIFSDRIDDQLLRDFKSNLKLEITGRSLSDGALADFALQAGDDKLGKHGFSKRQLEDDRDKALVAGSMIAEVTRESYQKAIADMPGGMALPFMPFSTNDGLQNVDWNEHYAFSRSLFSIPPIFEARKHDQWAAFAGVKTEGNRRWFDAFQSALDGRPRLAVSGSDAHQFFGKIGSNDQRGYGDFPSGKKTWIKANPTWEGLKQAIKEPANRSFIGSKPAKLERIEASKTFYIDSLTISRENAPASIPKWLDQCEIEFNPDLVAIIGNKGSGKSALADIVALLGQSQQNDHFSFLTRNRFRGKTGDPARFFRAKLRWLAGADGNLLLSEDAEPEQVELVRYIPQGRFEELCNDHVTGRSNEFERELRSVIFAHVPISERAGSTNFQELVERLEDSFRRDLAERRQEVSELNRYVADVENQLHPTSIKNVDEQLKLIDQQRIEHLRTKPEEVVEPKDDLAPEQAKAKDAILLIDDWLSLASDRAVSLRKTERKLNDKIQSIGALRSKIRRVDQAYADFVESGQQDAKSVRLDAAKLISLTTDPHLLNKRETKYRQLLDKIVAAQDERTLRTNELASLREEKANELAEPQQKYQNYLTKLKRWSDTLRNIDGTAEEPETRNGILARLDYLKNLPNKLDELKLRRRRLTKKIFCAIEAQRRIRETLFGHLQSVIRDDVLIPEEYQLSFQSNLDPKVDLFSSQLFDLVKQSSGRLRGEEKSLEAVRDIFEAHSLETENDAVDLADDLFDLLNEAARNINPNSKGLEEIVRKNRSVTAIYDHIYSLTFVEPKYTLLFQETQIEQLSPGQRGALLLIFYLLVDKGRNPIVLDQPEENLDNQTIVSLLVPVIQEAKKTRQIFMVTHNPNLAVVCDAEQIIVATFQRKGGPEISYRTGAVESSLINECVVNILEGTKLAFHNRGGKYL